MSKNNDEPIYTGGMLPEMVISSYKNTGSNPELNPKFKDLIKYEKRIK